MNLASLASALPAGWVPPVSVSPPVALHLLALSVSHNTLVVAAGVAAVGLAAGVVGSFGLLRKRPLVGDAAAHATLAGVAAAFLLTGRRDLPTLLGGALVAAVAGLGCLVLVRRFTRTRDDAATALVIGGGFGLGIALVSGITARGIPGGGGLEHFLLGHTAALTTSDALLMATVSAAAVGVVVATVKELTLVSFDAAFAAATGWPVTLLDQMLVTLVAVMVVVGLPAAGAVLVTELVVIPPVAARQWTDREATLVALSGAIGAAAGIVGVAVTTRLPGVPTGPVIVLAAAAACLVSVVAAPHRGWLARALGAAAERRRWSEGLVLDACLRAADAGDGTFTWGDLTTVGGRVTTRVWHKLLREGAVEPAACHDAAATPAIGRPAGGVWRLSSHGLARAQQRRRRARDWALALDREPESARAAFSLDLPECPLAVDARPETGM